MPSSGSATPCNSDEEREPEQAPIDYYLVGGPEYGLFRGADFLKEVRKGGALYVACRLGSTVTLWIDEEGIRSSCGGTPQSSTCSTWPSPCSVLSLYWRRRRAREHAVNPEGGVPPTRGFFPCPSINWAAGPVLRMYRDRVAPRARVLCVCASDQSRAYVRGRPVVERVLAWHRPDGGTPTYARLPPVEYGPAVVDGELVADAVVGGGWDAVDGQYDCVWFAGCSMMDFALGADRIGRIETLRRALLPGCLVLFTQVPAYAAVHNPTALDNKQLLTAVEFEVRAGRRCTRLGRPSSSTSWQRGGVSSRRYRRRTAPCTKRTEITVRPQA